MAVTVRLYDPYETELLRYEGRWTLTVDPFTPPVEAVMPINSFDVVILDPTAPTERLVDVWLVGPVADLTAGFTFDSDAPLAWVTDFEARAYGNTFGNTFAEWTYPTETTLLFDSNWDFFDLGPFTIDPASHASWFPAPPPPAYEARVVGMDGTSFGTLDDASIAQVAWELNGTGSAEVSLTTIDSDAALLTPGREVQIYHQGVLIWWGPIVRPQGGLDETTWQCQDLLWYFAHRFMGRADRVNQLTNGDFESSETNWAFEGVTHAVNTNMTYVLEGTKSERLEGTTADHDDFAYIGWTHPGGGHPAGDFLTASAWVYVTSADYLGGAAGDYGLIIIHRRGGIVIGGDAVTIDDDTLKDTWVPLEVGVAAVKEGDTIEVRLVPPHGVAYFDLVTLTFMESLSFGYPDTPVDVTDIIAGIVDYAQNRVFDHGKSDLNIDTTGDDTGETRQVAYQFAEHRNVLDAILEYVREGLCDISIEIGPTTRTFTVWPKDTDSRTPKLGKGVLYGTTLELDVNVADFTYSFDLENAASTVLILGPGDGPDRPEGVAIDTSFAGGAFTAEIVEQAPDKTTVGQLDARAVERLAIVARPEILEVTTLPGAGIIGDLVVGDTVPVVISRGWVDIDATYRVVRIEADLFNDQATITLNPLPA